MTRMCKAPWLLLAGGFVGWAVALAGCGGGDTARFVGSWAYTAGAKVAVDCGGGQVFDAPLDQVVETFAEGGAGLVKTDSQGCAGLQFKVAGAVASLDGAGQSCTIPPAGMSPGATFAPSAYSFALGPDGNTLTATVTAAYTPTGSPAACAVSGTTTLTRK